MQSGARLLVMVLLAVLAQACARQSTEPRGRSRGEHIRAGYVAALDRFDTACVRLADAVHGLSNGEAAIGGDTTGGAAVAKARAAFIDARRAYKRVEFLVEYYAPATAKSLNGPALSRVREDDPNRVVIAPEGLQAIEAMLYADAPPGGDTLTVEVDIVRSLVHRLRAMEGTLSFDDMHVFDAMRAALVRVMALGMSGFDTPASNTSITEAADVLGALRTVYALYADDLRARDAAMASRMDSLFDGAGELLAAGTDFARFDRLRFIRSYADPLYSTLGRAQGKLGIAFAGERRAIRAGATSLFAADAFDPWYYAPAYARAGAEDRIELGRTLFFDPVLSGNGARACASCHRPEQAFTDGRDRSVAFEMNGTVQRNAPTLVNAAFQAGYFYDRRVAFLEDQAAAVVNNPEEMHGSFADVLKRLGGSGRYREMFRRAFPADTSGGLAERNIRIAIAGYVRSLVAMGSPFDRYMRGDDAAMAEPARRGFNVFMGNGKCGTCHFVPLFNGTVPPGFTDTEVEILGTTARFDTVRPVLDPDPGRFGVHHIELERFAFKTPTLRNVALTAPYMHNGAFASLKDVIAFYNHGGGAGLGLELPTQTLPPDRLSLTAAETDDLLAFLHTLTDTSSLRGRPHALPEIPGIAARVIGGEY